MRREVKIYMNSPSTATKVISKVAYHTLQHNICLSVFVLINNSRTVDQENPLCECYILPYFSFPGDRSNLAYLWGKNQKNTSAKLSTRSARIKNHHHQNEDNTNNKKLYRERKEKDQASIFKHK